MHPTALILALTCTLVAPLAFAQGAAPAPAVASVAADCPLASTDADRAACEAAAASAGQVTTDAQTDRAETPVAKREAAAGDAMPTQGNAAPTDPRTDAEREFDALYGNGEPYDPVADPTLPDAAVIPRSYDPWERWNRRSHAINNAIDRRVAKPLAQAYMRAVPRPVRLGVSNFFNNLGQPVSAVNALLQGKPKQAGQSAGRFLLNSTLGIGGVFDPATDAKLPRKSEDFGQTLGVWGWKKSRYVELPVFGPRTVRDVLGMVGDAPLSPLRQVQADTVRVPLQGLQLVDLRTKLMSTDALREGVEDDYALVRDAWLQRRDYQILGDRMDAGARDSALPDYLQDDTLPIVPVDAVPMGGGG